ncbi:2-oxoacid:acceptor oxidoreductase family protein [Clostridium sp.]|jgi:pyruvate ferredoxin oxidoreductase gamma subunit|uniref:2-oxoacid:acceptor oxidoreductase family protein n=1 Tax=Clostridium sp. TaxID=1506 RepID=UPI003EEE6F48
MIEIRWHGRGGQGAFTAAKVLGAAASLYENKYALAFPTFGPERRGAPIQSFTKIDNEKIIDRSEIKKCDYIIVLDESIFDKTYITELKPGGKIIINTPHKVKYSKYGASIVTLDATSMALDIIKRPMVNTAMVGALVGISEIISLDSTITALQGFLKGSVLDRNREIIKASYNKVRGN